MANMFFNQKALEKMRKADDLEVALQISNPGVILTLLACAALLIGVFSWGIFGSVHTDIDVIAHRLSTVKHCDRIMVIDHGTIAEEGTYEELIAKNGIFAELVRRQRLDNSSVSLE